MDVEIVKKNGHKFRLSDYGVVKDFVVSSIDREVVRDSVDGRPGSLDYGVIEGDRSISVPFIFKSEDLHDYAHLRDELYSLLGDREPFYIREMRRPKTLQYDFVGFGQSPKWSSQTDNEYVNGKQYLVRLDSTINPSQEGLRGEVSLEFVTSGLPYAETAYTTLELHDSGYSATAEKYGLVDNIVDEKVKYRFEPDLKKVTLKSSDFEQGSISSATGANTTSTAEIRTVSYFETIPGETFTFKDDINGDSINYWWLFEYDENGGYLGYYNTPVGGDGELKFVATGHRLRVRSVSYNGIKPADVGIQTLPSIEGIDDNNKFTVYNAGNVTIEPESMYISILFYYCSIPDGKMTVKNLTTGDVLEVNRTTNRSHIRQDGMVFTIAGVNFFRDTNRKFISLAPGDNKFEITGATYDEVRIDFKYYYK